MSSGKKVGRLSEWIFTERILIYIQDNTSDRCYSKKEKTKSQRWGREQWPANPKLEC